MPCFRHGENNAPPPRFFVAGEVPDLGGVAEVVQVDALPNTEREWEALTLGRPWVFLRFGHEDPTDWPAFRALLENLRALPTEIAAVQVLRREASLTGEREMPVVRAFRPESRRGLPHPTVPWAVQGRTVGVDGITLLFRRATYADPVGRAEAAEAGGDLVRAAESWHAIGDILDDAWGAYASMRSALLVARVAPGADLVRARLMRSIERCPNLPEALVAMARWWTARGQTARALEWGQVAAAIHAPARGVPHPRGLGDGWVRRELQGLFSTTTEQGGAPSQSDS